MPMKASNDPEKSFGCLQWPKLAYLGHDLDLIPQGHTKNVVKDTEMGLGGPSGNNFAI